MDKEGDLTLGGGHATQSTDGVSWKCTRETYVIV